MNPGDVVRIARGLKEPWVGIVTSIGGSTMDIDVGRGRPLLRLPADSTRVTPWRPGRPVSPYIAIIGGLAFIGEILWWSLFFYDRSGVSLMSGVIVHGVMVALVIAALLSRDREAARWLPEKSQRPRFPESAIEAWMVYQHWDGLNGRYSFDAAVVLESGETRDIVFDADTNVAVTGGAELIGQKIVRYTMLKPSQASTSNQ